MRTKKLKDTNKRLDTLNNGKLPRHWCRWGAVQLHVLHPRWKGAGLNRLIKGRKLRLNSTKAI